MEIEEHFFTSAADADFQRLYERYGDVFYDAVDRAIERLRRFPESGPTYEAPVRRLVIHGTPLGLFYGLHGKTSRHRCRSRPSPRSRINHPSTWRVILITPAINNPLIQEVRDTREALPAKFDFDLHRIFVDAMKRQESGKTVTRTAGTKKATKAEQGNAPRKAEDGRSLPDDEQSHH